MGVLEMFACRNEYADINFLTGEKYTDMIVPNFLHKRIIIQFITLKCEYFHFSRRKEPYLVSKLPLTSL